MESTYAEKLFSRFDEAAKNWGAAQADESMENRKLLRFRNAYYKARREILDYYAALERTVKELDAKEANMIRSLSSEQPKF